MKAVLSCLVVSLLAAAASAQVPIPPFPTWMVENYDVGAYNFFPAMGGWAFAGRATPGGALIVGNTTWMPPVSPPNAMFGENTDQEWRFVTPIKRFGGKWRVGLGATWITAVRFQFFNAANVNWFTSPPLPVNTTSWTWYGYWLFVPSVKVRVLGVPGGGWIGAEDTLARP